MQSVEKERRLSLFGELHNTDDCEECCRVAFTGSEGERQT